MKGQASGECYPKSNTSIFATSFLETASGDIWIGFKTFAAADGMAAFVRSLYLTLADKHQ
jgi:hypothetical protein